MPPIDLWNSIKKQFASRHPRDSEAALDSIPTAVTFQPIISSCLPLLHSCPAGTMLYILDCLCPEDFPILDFGQLDLSPPHHHRRLSTLEVRLRPKCYEGLLSHLRAQTSIIPAKDYPRFWLELTRSCLLTSPVDPDYYREDQSGKELFCQRLRSELIERILRID
jgi:hypothetical protein